MKRRAVITLLGSAAAALPSFLARAQIPTKRALIGFLLLGSKTATEHRVSGFPLGMQKLGYVEGRDYAIAEGGYANGDAARFPAVVQELIRLKPDIILTGTTI